jgi:hemerythrin
MLKTQDAIKKTTTHDECMVSFDVTALSLLKKWLKQHITHMDSVKLCVELT